jgi:hypothetical protein
MKGIKLVLCAVVLSLVFLAATSSSTVDAQGLVEYELQFLLTAIPPGESGALIALAPSHSYLQPPQTIPVIICALLENTAGGDLESTDKSVCVPWQHGGPQLVFGHNVSATPLGETGYVSLDGVLTPSMGPTPSRRVLACYSYENRAGGKFVKTELSNCQ